MRCVENSEQLDLVAPDIGPITQTMVISSTDEHLDAIFTRVEIDETPEPAPVAAGSIVVLFPSGTRMHIQGAVDPLVLGTVMDALAR